MARRKKAMPAMVVPSAEASYAPASQVMEGTLTAGETCGGKRPYGPRRGGKDGLEAMAAKKKIKDYGSMSRNQLLAALKIEV